MKYVYEAVVEPIDDLLEVRFPDLDIVTQGDDTEDAALMAQDLLENYLVVLLQLGKEIPEPTFKHSFRDEGFTLLVTADVEADTPQVETMSVPDAAVILSLTPVCIYDMVHSGELVGRKVGDELYVETQSVINAFNERG